MRVCLVRVFVLQCGHGCAGFVVGKPIAFNIAGQSFMLFAVYFEHAGEIARIANIHGIGNGMMGLFGQIISAAQVIGDHPVAVGCRNKPVYLQSHFFCDQARSEVAEIAAGDAENQFFAWLFYLRCRIEIEKGLRKKACKVN